MKICAGVAAYNAECIIGASLRSIYDYVDHIFVIDGSADGPSTDNTAKVAKSVGKKVQVVSATFQHPGGIWGETIQRQVYISLGKRYGCDWCILHDSDEVFDADNIQRLVKYCQNASTETKLFSYQWIHFWRDPWHIIEGGQWSQPRWVGTFRLLPKMKQLSINTVGIEGVSDWTKERPPIKIILKDVMFYHYGHCLSYERQLFKVKQFVGQRFFKGYNLQNFEKFKKDWTEQSWNKGINIGDQVKEYKGEHPPEVRPLLKKMETFWSKR